MANALLPICTLALIVTGVACRPASAAARHSASRKSAREENARAQLSRSTKPKMMNAPAHPKTPPLDPDAELQIARAHRPETKAPRWSRIWKLIW